MTAHWIAAAAAEARNAPIGARLRHSTGATTSSEMSVMARVPAVPVVHPAEVGQQQADDQQRSRQPRVPAKEPGARSAARAAGLIQLELPSA